MTDQVTEQPLPITQQFRDEVAAARDRLRAAGKGETVEQREALQSLNADTLTREEIVRIAGAFSLSADQLLKVTNDVRKVGAPGGPG